MRLKQQKYFTILKACRVIWTSVCAIPQFKPGEAAPFQTYITLSDITELKRVKDALEIRVKERTAEIAEANDRLKSYAWQIIGVQDAERKQIAFELHNDTVQYLSILKLKMESIPGSGKIRSAGMLDKLNHLKEDVNRAIQDILRYSRQLRLSVLDHIGLSSALEQLVQDIQERSTLKVGLSIKCEEGILSDEVRLALFRITQEALNNAHKHAEATRVGISLEFRGDTIKIVIAENGKGFKVKKEISSAASRGSLGPSSMWQRAELIDARLEAASHAGKGTRVILTLSI